MTEKQLLFIEKKLFLFNMKYTIKIKELETITTNNLDKNLFNFKNK